MRYKIRITGTTVCVAEVKYKVSEYPSLRAHVLSVTLSQDKPCVFDDYSTAKAIADDLKDRFFNHRIFIEITET